MPTYKGKLTLFCILLRSLELSIIRFFILCLVKVKWGKELFNNVEVNTDDIPLVFKAQLFDLTGVQPERQKVMLKGTVLKDNEWGNIKLADVSFQLTVYYCYFIRWTLMTMFPGNDDSDDGFKRRRCC